ITRAPRGAIQAFARSCCATAAAHREQRAEAERDERAPRGDGGRAVHAAAAATLLGSHRRRGIGVSRRGISRRRRIGLILFLCGGVVLLLRGGRVLLVRRVVLLLPGVVLLLLRLLAGEDDGASIHDRVVALEDQLDGLAHLDAVVDALD